MLKRYFNRYNRIGNLTEPTCFKINTFVYSVYIYIYIYYSTFCLNLVGYKMNRSLGGGGGGGQNNLLNYG